MRLESTFYKILSTLSSLCLKPHSLLLALILFLAQHNARAEAPDNWKLNNTQLVSSQLYSLEDQFYSLSADYIFRSSDGSNWSIFAPDSELRTKWEDSYVGLLYNNGNFYAPAQSRGNYSRSFLFWKSNGNTPWLQTSGFTGNRISGGLALASGNGFLLAAYNGEIRVSQNGEVWASVVRYPSDLFTSPRVTFAAGRFIVIADKIYTNSGNPLNVSDWQSSEAPPAKFSVLSSIPRDTSGKTRFVGISPVDFNNSTIWESTDESGTSFKPWSILAGVGPIQQITSGRGAYLARSAGNIYLSLDFGANWKSVAVAPQNTRFGDIVCNSQRCIVGLISSKNVASGIWGSIDGEHWSESLHQPGVRLNAIAAQQNEFLALGTDSAASSGNSWIYSSPSLPSSTAFTNIVTANGAFYGMGSFPQILVSTDRNSWKTALELSNCYFRDLAYGNAAYVAVGYCFPTQGGANTGIVARSKDAISWTFKNIDTPLATIAFGNGKFVTFGENSLMYSTDGAEWVATTAPAAGYRIRYIKDRFIAFKKVLSEDYFYSDNFKSVISQSFDGVNWSVLLQDSQGMYDLNYGCGYWVAVGADILYSKDLTNWSPAAGDALLATRANPLMSLAFGDNRFVAVGGDSRILENTILNCQGTAVEISPSPTPSPNPSCPACEIRNLKPTAPVLRKVSRGLMVSLTSKAGMTYILQVYKGKKLWRQRQLNSANTILRNLPKGKFSFSYHYRDMNDSGLVSNESAVAVMRVK